MNKYYWITTKVDNYYKFINKINSLNIKINEIKYKNNKIYLKVDENTYKIINKYLVSYDFVIDSELGVYKIINIIKQYHIFIISLIIGILFFLVISNLTIDIQVIHDNKEIRELILDELNDNGIKVLGRKKSYKELQVIKKKILKKYPDKIDWLEFEIDGMKLKVRLEERIITNINKESDKCHILAKKDGMISSIKIESGVANVALFDNVKAGDILISGIITHNNEEVSRVCAKGLVYANTWYVAKIYIPFKSISYKETGKKKYNIVIDNGINKIQILKPRFNNYEKKYKTILKFLNYKILLEKEIEQKRIVNKYSEKELLNIALKKAEENILKKLGKNDRVIDKKVLKKIVNNSKMDIEVFIVVNEQIGYTSKITQIEEGIDSNVFRYN